MNQQDAFLQAIREDPTDDEVRLVFADWLEDQGDPRAELIRLQCQIGYQYDAGNIRLYPILDREEKLRRKHGKLWLGSPPRGFKPELARGMLEVELRSEHLQQKAVELWWQQQQPWITKVCLAPLTDEDLAGTLTHRMLKDTSWLEIWYCDVTTAGFEALPSLTQLRALSLMDDLWAVDDDLFLILRELTPLRALEIHETMLTEQGLKHLDTLTQLRHLQFDYLSGEGLRHIAKIPSLRVLRLFWANISRGRDFAPLADLPILEELVLHNLKLNGAALRHLSGISSLRKLSLDQQLNPAALKQLGQMTQLEELNLWITDPPKSEWLLHLTPLQLRSLSLKSTDLSGSGIHHLAQLQNLEGLDVRRCDLNDQDLEMLGQIEGLKDLHLQGNRINGEALKHLIPLTSLEMLSLDETRVDDSAIPFLKQLPNLKWLGLRKTAITKKGATALRRSKPGLYILT